MMARSKNPVAPLALSIQQTAQALGIRRVSVADAVKRGVLPLYIAPTGNRRGRIIIEDTLKWVRNWKRG